MLVGFVVLGLVVVVVAGWIGIAYNRATAAGWRGAADQLGLVYSPGKGFSGRSITGTMATHPVRVDAVNRGGGNSQHVVTRFRVSYPPLGFDLSLGREHALRRLTKLFGAQDVEVGDPAFDEAFIVKTSDPARAAALLTPAVRDSLLRLLAAYPQVQVGDNRISLERTGLIRRSDALVSITRRLLAAARALTDTDPGPHDRLIDARRRGELRSVAERLGETVAADPDDVDTRLREMDTLAAAGEEEAAAERLTALERLLPADPEVQGWKRTLRQQPDPAPPAGVSDDPGPLATDLFAGDDLSFETLAKFNQRYRGLAIRWQGRVKEARPFRNDPDLGEGPGVRATVTVAQVDNDLYGNTEIDLVAGLPDDAGRRPLTQGDDVVVEGTLSGCDPLSRNLFVGDATAHL
jgi:hypothetical protein